MKKMIFYILLLCMGMLFVQPASAQRMPERGLVRKGNRQYNRENINGSIESYQEALKHNPNCFEAKYDLASALYRAKRYDASEKMLQSIVNDSTRTVLERGEVAYNLGNTQFAQQKFKEALSSYRFAMHCNPHDEDAKHNYALTKLMLKQQQEQQQQQDKDKEQNQDNKENQQGKNDQSKGDDKNQDGQPPQEQEGKPEKQDEGSRPEGGMSQKQQEALLQAVQAEEDKTQDKLKEKAGVLIRGGKNW